MTQVEVTQADREYRVRELLGFEAGYEISKYDAAQDCSVLAKHAVTAAIRFADEARLTAEAAKDAEIAELRARVAELEAVSTRQACNTGPRDTDWTVTDAGEWLARNRDAILAALRDGGSDD